MSLEQNQVSEKSRLITFLLAFFFGFFGADRFYSGKIVSGIIKIITASGFGVWWLIDWIMVLSGSYKDNHGKFIINWEAKQKTLVTIIIFICIFCLLLIASRNSNKSNLTTSRSSEQKNEDKIYKIGESIKTDDLNITVTNYEVRNTIGGNEYFEGEKASEGAFLICIKYKYKNISKEPLSSFSQPNFKLKDNENIEYSSDTGKTIAYSTETNINEKILSDLNPGITVQGAEVYEISKDSWKKAGWKLKIDYSYETFEVSLK